MRDDGRFGVAIFNWDRREYLGCRRRINKYIESSVICNMMLRQQVLSLRLLEVLRVEDPPKSDAITLDTSYSTNDLLSVML